MKYPVRKQLGWKCFRNTKASAKKMIIKINVKNCACDSSISGADTKLTAPADRLWLLLHRYMCLGRDFDAHPRYLHHRNQSTGEQLMESEMVLTLVRLLLVSCTVFSELLLCRSESWKLVLMFAVGPISLRDSRALSLSGACSQCLVLSGCRTRLRYGVSTYTARKELTYTVKRD